MNKKGQMNGVGGLILIAVAIIVGVVFLQSIAQNVGDSVNKVEVVNTSLTTVVNNTAQYLTDIKSIEDVVIYNETGNAIVSSADYTITNNVVHNGALAVEILPDTTAAYKSAWQVSGTAEPLTYISESGGRTIANLIVIMFALAILAIVLAPVAKESMGWS